MNAGPVPLLADTEERSMNGQRRSRPGEATCLRATLLLGLVSCAAGQSRSVSLAIGVLIRQESSSLVDAAHEVIAGVPRARPHPLVLVGVARACDLDPELAELRAIYDALDLETHELGWPDATLRAALAE